MELNGIKIVRIYVWDNVYSGMLTKEQSMQLIKDIAKWGRKNNLDKIVLAMSFGDQKLRYGFKDSDIKSIDELIEKIK